MQLRIEKRMHNYMHYNYSKCSAGNAKEDLLKTIEFYAVPLAQCEELSCVPFNEFSR